MPRETKPRGPTPVARDGPVRPGSPLYRLLLMVATDIAVSEPEGRRPARPDGAHSRGDPGDASGRCSDS